MGHLPVAHLDYYCNHEIAVLAQKMSPAPDDGRREHGILSQNQQAKAFFPKAKALFL